MQGSAANVTLGREIGGLRSVFRSWWRDRVSFAISLSITLGTTALYLFTCVGERPTPLFQFVERLELNSLDTRFRFRPARLAPADPRIVIVDIDQHSQEVLGRWPFSRKHFATLLDVLREDGAASKELVERLEMFARGRRLYQQRKCAEAQKSFQELLARWPGDGPSRTYWKRCQEYLFEEPEANWDGVYVMTHK